MAGKTDLIGAFRAYAQKALGNDFNAEKAAIALNSWVKESGDALKERIERETERAVKKLGLAKESDLRALREEIVQLRKSLGLQAKAAKKQPSRSAKVAKKNGATKSAKGAKKSGGRGSSQRSRSGEKKRRVTR